MDVTYLVKEFREIYEVENSSSFYTTHKDEYFICRYCGTDNKKKFKSVAHLIPEFTGNTEIFSFNECDDCNHLFSKYETSLSAFGGIKNVFVPIKGKKKFPKFKDNKDDFTLQYRDKSTLITTINGESDIVKYEDNLLNVNAKTQSFIPLYVYKAIVKFAISLLKKEELFKFKETIEWLLVPDKQIEIIQPHLLIVNDDARPPLITPMSVLFKKKKEFNCPEYCFVFMYGFHRYQIFLHFNESDKILDFTDLKLPLSYDFVLKRGEDKIAFKHYNMNYLNKSSIKQKFSLNYRQK